MTEQVQNNTLSTTNQSSRLRIGKCEEFTQHTKEEYIAKVVVFVFLFLFCVSLNSLVIVLVYKTKKLHKDICYLVVNMAVSDMLVMTLGLQEWLNILFSNSAESWKVGGTLGTISCKLGTWLRYVAPLVSITTLIAISVERLKAVSSMSYVQPIRRAIFFSMVGLSWLFPLAVYFYIFYIFDIITYERDIYCINLKLDRNGWILYHLIFYAILVTLFVLLVTLNLVLMKKLHTSQQAIHLPEEQKKKRELKFVRAVRMVLCCALLFVVCWGPRSILKFLDHLNVLRFDYCVTKNLFFLIEFLFYLNFSLSPATYFVFLKDFRNALKEAMR